MGDMRLAWPNSSGQVIIYFLGVMLSDIALDAR